jgi:exportin-2 (importin alpha re-exporter)
MIGVMRVMTVSRDTLAPFLQVSIQHLLSILAEISKNPSNPRFNHYLFECIAALIRYHPLTSSSNVLDSLVLLPPKTLHC